MGRDKRAGVRRRHDSNLLDSGVLLAAARSVSRDRETALRVLEDSERTFLTSAFIQLEVLPKAVFHKKALVRAFYDEYFRAAEWIRDIEAIVSGAEADAARLGLSAMDALHLAAAQLGGAEEFLTTESRQRPIHRAQWVRVKCIFERF